MDIGFTEVGSWSLVDGDLALDLDRHAQSSNVLYAFAVGQELKYIGKTTMSLQRRMYGYLRPGATQRTNIKNHENIKRGLMTGKPVRILAFPDDGSRKIGEFHLNVAAGLEDSLIAVLDPEWNGMRYSAQRGEKQKTPTTNQTTAECDTQNSLGTTSHTVILQPTYMKSGFFNVPVRAASAYGTDKEKIQIYCGGSRVLIAGHINRTANVNGTPRIMGGVSLRNWFMKTFDEGDVAQINVVDKNSIEISKVSRSEEE